jgi:hypothetical protein
MASNQDINDFKNKILRESMSLSKHAEETAIEKYRDMMKTGIIKRSMRKRLHILVIRTNKEGELKESKPCDHCVRIMKETGIKKVTYSSGSGTLITESLIHIISRPSVGYKCIRESLIIIDNILNKRSLK